MSSESNASPGDVPPLDTSEIGLVVFLVRFSIPGKIRFKLVADCSACEVAVEFRDALWYTYSFDYEDSNGVLQNCKTIRFLF